MNRESLFADLRMKLFSGMKNNKSMCEKTLSSRFWQRKKRSKINFAAAAARL